MIFKSETLKRHKEYEQVFEGLYKEVKKNPKNAISYIGGDIAHSKTEMSPELSTNYLVYLKT